MHTVRLALLAIWRRKGRALTLLLVSTVAVTAAVVGPMYSRAAEESLLRDRLQREPPQATGVDIGVATSSSLQIGQAADSAVEIGSNPRLDSWFTRPVLGIQVVKPVPVVVKPG